MHIKPLGGGGHKVPPPLGQIGLSNMAVDDNKNFLKSYCNAMEIYNIHKWGNSHCWISIQTQLYKT